MNMNSSNEPHGKIRENLPAFVLGGLEPEEVRVMEEHLRGCEQCRREIASYETVTHALDLSAPDAPLPEGARERLLERTRAIGGSPQAEDAGASRSSRRRPSRLPWALAAASLLLAVLLGGALWQQNRQLSNEVAAQQNTITSVVDLMERADLKVKDLPTPMSEARVRVYEAREGDVGMIVFDRLPQPPAGKKYQLWVGSGGGLRSEGTFVLTSVEKGSYHKLLNPSEGFDKYDRVGVLMVSKGGLQKPPPASDPDWAIRTRL